MNGPDSLPNYMREGVPKQDNESLRDLRDWVERLLEQRRLSEEDLEVEEGEEIVEVESTGSKCTVIKRVRCGKPSCSTCPHGPYRYVVTSKGGSQSWEYKGRADV